MTYRKKLIEVALPLEAINKAAAKEKSIRHGHPSTLHLWWARRPLAACRAVVFASLVDDPGNDLPDEAAERERRRLFKLIEALVRWENSNSEPVLRAAREEILKSCRRDAPPVFDPFCGGGSIPLEAQRLGLRTRACDLNPVAVLITKALTEIPARFAGRRPVNPSSREKIGYDEGWVGANGLAVDVRYYGARMREEAERRILHLYPGVRVPKTQGSGVATAIAWLWARTVKCPNPVCAGEMPLVRSFALSTKKGSEAWIEPVAEKKKGRVRFEVRNGKGPVPDGTVGRRGARCLLCETNVPLEYVRAEGRAGRIGAALMAVVAEKEERRVYAPPNTEHLEAAARAAPRWVPESDLPERALSFRVQTYGMTKHRDLFTARQLATLTTFCDLVGSMREAVLADARAGGLSDDPRGLASGGDGAVAYADAVATYLGIAVDRLADRNSTLCTWDLRSGSGRKSGVRNVFARQALPMTWDFAEANPFGDIAGSIESALAWIDAVLVDVPAGPIAALVEQRDAQTSDVERVMVSTDPPYYDNIGYADLSDFFYIWMRRSLSGVFPDLFSTVLVPKAQELVANPYRFGGSREDAARFFEEGLGKVFARIRAAQHPEYPLTVYYAFKQAEEDDEDENGEAAVASTGWETMLDGLLRAGFTTCGTWPMRSELETRNVGRGTNALASSIVLVCRPRPADAALATRREFLTALKRELPVALVKLQHGNIAPVDLAQASIGPGMAIFSRHSKVLEADGSAMSVRTALQLINQELDAYLTAQEGEIDPDTRFCISWFEQYGMDEAKFGEADILARAKNTSVDGLVEAGVLRAKAGKVRILKRDEYPDNWDPAKDRRLTVWECTQHLIRQLDTNGEEGAATLSARLGAGRSDDAKALAYRLYAICDRKGWAEEALAYNRLVTSWDGVQTRVAEAPRKTEQLKLGV